MKKTAVFFAALLTLLIAVNADSLDKKQEWCKKTDADDKAPRISAEEVRRMLLSKEKIIFVYSGSGNIKQVLCGSIYIPSSLVPPMSDGSKLNLAAIPKDYWLICYCACPAEEDSARVAQWFRFKGFGTSVAVRFGVKGLEKVGLALCASPFK
jgi:rhodanese-related sulfurtransferase